MLTYDQKNIVLNLIIQEMRNIHGMNANIQAALDDYKKVLSDTYKAICNTMED